MQLFMRLKDKVNLKMQDVMTKLNKKQEDMMKNRELLNICVAKLMLSIINILLNQIFLNLRYLRNG